MKQTLLILMAVALVGGCGKLAEARKKSQLTGCRLNLKNLSGAIDMYGLEQVKSDDHEVTMDDLKKYLSGGIPKCPSGGEYEVTTVGEDPTCTIEGHTIDH